jgi:hypothetical protein
LLLEPSQLLPLLLLLLLPWWADVPQQLATPALLLVTLRTPCFTAAASQ